MPNHIKNTLSFSGDPKKISEMREKIKNDKFGLGSIDFEKIIPMPDKIYRGDLGRDEMEKYGKDNWYDWRAGHWGTKWNTYGFEDYIDYGICLQIRCCTRCFSERMCGFAYIKKNFASPSICNDFARMGVVLYDQAKQSLQRKNRKES